ENTAGIVVEGIQSDGGLVVPPDDFLPQLQKLCVENNIYLIMDEVKIGLGRTGKWFSFEHLDVEPDAVVLGKPLGGGLPISSVIAKKEILDAGTANHMFTASGNPVSAAAALETISVIEENKMMQNAESIGNYLKKQLKELQKKHEIIGDIRGKGLVIGVELVNDRHTKEPAAKGTSLICYRAYELGLLVYYVGIFDNVIEITLPLTISKKEVDLAIEILDKSIQDYQENIIISSKYEKYGGWS